MSWQLRNTIFYTGVFLSWFPHYSYLKGLSRKINKIYLLKGGKYCRVECVDYNGVKKMVWLTITDLHLLNKEHNRFDDEYHFLNEEGQLQHEVAVECDYFSYGGVPHNNETIYFLKQGTVHAPEIFENIIRGYNIDDTDYEINTEDNVRFLEPDANY